MQEYVNNFKKKKDNTKKNNKTFITKFLISIIFFLISIIITNKSDKLMSVYREYVYKESIPFTKVKSWYEDLFGSILPKENNTKLVMSEGKLLPKSINNYLDGEVLKLENNTLINTLTSGVVVYMGQKEGYGNTIIIQGIDGVDIWYGNIDKSNIKLYDYIEKNTLLGETISDQLYLVIKKDNEYIKYEDYQA